MNNMEKKTGCSCQAPVAGFLRYGYTSGSCAAAAAKASAYMLLSGKECHTVELLTPKGILLTLSVYEVKMEEGRVSCAIQKDAGDDADVTDGMFVHAGVCFYKEQSRGIWIQGGEGIGRVTKPGLDQKPGEWAINSGPRLQITKAVEEVADAFGCEGALLVTIWIPNGRELAKKTFNPNLGIEGGLSIIGTSGIVEPMSEEALLASIRLEIHVKAQEGRRFLLLTPGNYGQDFIRKKLGLSLGMAVKCSNFIGDALQMAWEEPFDGILLIGHLGKLVKLGAGRLNTHSKYGDGRMEELARCMELAGYGGKENPVLSCVTTEDAVVVLEEMGLLEQTMGKLMGRIMSTVQGHFWVQGHVGHCPVEVIMFSKQNDAVWETEGAGELLEKCR